MEKQKKQTVLTALIILLIIILIVMIGSIIYEEKIVNKQETQKTISSGADGEDKNTIIENEEIQKGNDIENNVQDEVKEESKENVSTEDKKEYVGEEESTTQENNVQSKDQKAIVLAKKEWGDDNSVTFTIEEKQGNKYYVAVKSDATVLQWYEVDTETWEINEYY